MIRIFCPHRVVSDDNFS